MSPDSGSRRPHRIVSLLKGSTGVLRDGWLILGVVLALFLALELIYRAQVTVRSALGGDNSREVLFPSEAPDWTEAYLKEELATYDLTWRPYVYFRRVPFAGQFINVDSSGRRVTHPTGAAASPVVWLFGGSTMFGTFQRDSHTIPSALAAEFDRRGTPIRAVNWGETGYVFTQEVVELLLQLRSGARPDVVVFYDGINDVVAALQHAAGTPQTERQRARDFAMGRIVFSWDRDLAADGRALGTLAAIGVSRSHLITRLRNLRPGSLPLREPEAVSEDVLRTYIGTIEVVEAAADYYGFRPIYLWQPTLHLSSKIRTAEEEELVRRIDASPFHRRVRQVHARVAANIDSAMAGVAPGRFVNLTDLFANRSKPIFVDVIGHTVEAANPLIVERLRPLVSDALTKPSATVSASASDPSQARKQ